MDSPVPLYPTDCPPSYEAVMGLRGDSQVSTGPVVGQGAGQKSEQAVVGQDNDSSCDLYSSTTSSVIFDFPESPVRWVGQALRLLCYTCGKLAK